MNAKERFYSGLAKETIGKITSNTDNWTSFLRTMSRNYEFTYPEQVMIYAQRPNATFCKPYEDWNAENYRRYVKRGSTGIALFVMNRDKPYLRYVFDVADTGVRRSSPELKPWEVTPENRSYVMEAMERTFGVAADGVLEAQLEDIASALAAEYWDDYKKQLLDIVANSFLEEYDELNIEVAFKNAVANSVSADPVPLGSYRGFQMELSFDSFRNEFDVTLKGAVSHRVALGTDARGNITRLDNALAGIPERLERANEQLNNLYNQQEAAKAEVGKPFPQEAELTAKSQRLAELDAALNMEDSAEKRDERSESERPSVLADLKSKAEHIPPAKYSEPREEVL